MTKKKLATDKNQYIPAIAVSFIFLLLVGFVVYNKQLNTKKEVSEIDQTVSVTDAGEWPTYPETEDWDVYENKNMNFSIKYPSDKIILFMEREGMVVFTTPSWKDAIVIPPLALQILDRNSGSAKAAIVNETAPQNGVRPRVNTESYTINRVARAYRLLRNSVTKGNDLYVEGVNQDRNVLRISTHDDPRLTPEEQASNLRELNMMISTFEYLE
ncbi:hypothetical protein C4564_01295 [Candidatus Microgenomates bacterium]|nr:MAG: hypothetical protein C4564_01295 [Candidatus Microgenomates bacterium]